MTPRCETCRHWLGSQTDNWSGVCRRHASVIASNFKRGLWPATARSDLCGDFERLPPTAEERDDRILWAIKGPRGYFASDGAQSAWVNNVDPADAYGADTFSTKEEGLAHLSALPIRASEKVGVEVVMVPQT